MVTHAARSGCRSGGAVRCPLQAALGDQHDAVVASDTARDIGVRAHLAGENAFGFGVLYQRCQQDAVTRAVRARDDMRRAFRPRYARWLR